MDVSCVNGQTTTGSSLYFELLMFSIMVSTCCNENIFYGESKLHISVGTI